MSKLIKKIRKIYTKTASKYGHSAIMGFFALSLFINHTALAISSSSKIIGPEMPISNVEVVKEPINEKQTMVVEITAYSSTVDQTDDTPFIAASGKHVYDGMVAANFLPLGTKIKIPEIFGDKVFTVDDRMNKRYQNRIDIWYPTRNEAVRFGFRTATIEIVTE